MSDWPRYQSHKVIQATAIVRKDGGDGYPTALFVAPQGVEKRFDTTVPGMMARAEVGDYAMIYPDGFQSVCPKAQFEDGYSLIEVSEPLGAAVRRLGIADPMIDINRKRD
jgi:hypothetical protein